MNEQATQNFILVDSRILPEVFMKVLEAKQLLDTKEVKTIHEATQAVGISRSAFYKYKDHVFFLNGMQEIITVSLLLLDASGLLSNILNYLAEANANILTINQNIPVNGVANIIISMQTAQMTREIDEVVRELSHLSGVKKIDVLARQ